MNTYLGITRQTGLTGTHPSPHLSLTVVLWQAGGWCQWSSKTEVKKKKKKKGKKSWGTESKEQKWRSRRWEGKGNPMWAKQNNSIRKGGKSPRRFATNLLKPINLIFNSVSRIQVPELFYLTISYKTNKNYTFRVITMVIRSLLKECILLPSFWSPDTSPGLHFCALKIIFGSWVFLNCFSCSPAFHAIWNH